MTNEIKSIIVDDEQGAREVLGSLLKPFLISIIDVKRIKNFEPFENKRHSRR